MSWFHAVLVAAAVVVVSVALLVYVPNLLVTRLGGSRSFRVGVATAAFFVSLVALAVALRRLQRRHVL